MPRHALPHARAIFVRIYSIYTILIVFWLPLSFINHVIIDGTIYQYTNKNHIIFAQYNNNIIHCTRIRHTTRLIVHNNILRIMLDVDGRRYQMSLYGQADDLYKFCATARRRSDGGVVRVEVLDHVMDYIVVVTACVCVCARVIGELLGDGRLHYVIISRLPYTAR